MADESKEEPKKLTLRERRAARKKKEKEKKEAEKLKQEAAMRNEDGVEGSEGPIDQQTDSSTSLRSRQTRSNGGARRR